MSNLLFIDDDLEILAINMKYFTKEGYTVKTASCAKTGIQILKTFQPDCIILDVMMPQQNGFETCRLIRTLSTAPVIFLSGRSSEDDKINGLMIGADDYMVKPYSFRELATRIQVQIRRQKSNTTSNRLSYPPLSLDLALHKAYHDKDEIPLSNREYELLYLLVSHANLTVTFDEIGNQMWGCYSDADRRTIMVTASRLRKKMEGYDALTNSIESVWSKGYIFHAK